MKKMQTSAMKSMKSASSKMKESASSSSKAMKSAMKSAATSMKAAPAAAVKNAMKAAPAMKASMKKMAVAMKAADSDDESINSDEVATDDEPAPSMKSAPAAAPKSSFWQSAFVKYGVSLLCVLAATALWFHVAFFGLPDMSNLTKLVDEKLDAVMTLSSGYVAQLTSTVEEAMQSVSSAGGETVQTVKTAAKAVAKTVGKKVTADVETGDMGRVLGEGVRVAGKKAAAKAMGGGM